MTLYTTGSFSPTEMRRNETDGSALTFTCIYYDSILNAKKDSNFNIDTIDNVKIGK